MDTRTFPSRDFYNIACWIGHTAFMATHDEGRMAGLYCVTMPSGSLRQIIDSSMIKGQLVCIDAKRLYVLDEGGNVLRNEPHGLVDAKIVYSNEDTVLLFANNQMRWLADPLDPIPAECVDCTGCTIRHVPRTGQRLIVHRRYGGEDHWMSPAGIENVPADMPEPVKRKVDWRTIQWKGEFLQFPTDIMDSRIIGDVRCLGHRGRLWMRPDVLIVDGIPSDNLLYVVRRSDNQRLTITRERKGPSIVARVRGLIHT